MKIKIFADDIELEGDWQFQNRKRNLQKTAFWRRFQQVGDEIILQSL